MSSTDNTKLSLSAAFSYAGGRLTTRGGMILAAVYVLYQLAMQVSVQSLGASLVAGRVPSGELASSYPLAVGMPAAVSGVLTVLLGVGGIVLSIVAMRALYHDIDNVPTAEHTRNLVRTVLVLVAVSIITTIAVLLGTIALFVPGIFLAVSLVFAQLAVTIEDAGVVESLERSWALTSGHRLRLFFLGVAVFTIALVVGAIIGFLNPASPALGNVVSSVVTGVFSVYSIALLVGAYRQLVDATDESDADTTGVRAQVR